MSDFWKTSISRVRPGEILVRGFPIEQLMRHCSFGDVVYLLLKGELPTGAEGKMVGVLLVSCCEHSLASPSVDAVRFVASCGVPLQTAVAAGVSAIGDVHGGAMEPCAVVLKDAVATGKDAAAVVREFRNSGRRMPGFGHPVHRQQDPRVVALLELAAEWDISAAHTALAHDLERCLEQELGRRLPMNVDGVIAALLCDMEIDPALGKTFFIVSRAAGYAAHAYEQTTAERPFKAPGIAEITYTGPEKRDVPRP
jgi:citrate synthase